MNNFEACKFIDDPTFNPKTGRRINLGGTTYMKLRKECENAGYKFLKENYKKEIIKTKEIKKQVKNDLIKQLEVCDNLISYSLMFIESKKCKLAVCPKFFVDIKTGRERPLKGTDVISKCEEWSCALDQMKKQNEVYKGAAESGYWKGISNSSSLKQMTKEDYIELTQHVQKFCKRQTGTLTDMVFAIDTFSQPKLTHKT